MVGIYPNMLEELPGIHLVPLPHKVLLVPLVAQVAAMAADINERIK